MLDDLLGEWAAKVQCTELEATKRITPTGMKMSPIRTKLRITALGVRIGCQALNLCCLKALSKDRQTRSLSR